MQVEAPPQTGNTELDNWLKRLWNGIIGDHLYGSATWDAAEIADGDEEAKEVTISGAELGDQAIASLSIDIADLVLDAQVTAAGTVTCVLANNTGGAINLDSATVYVRVFKKIV